MKAYVATTGCAFALLFLAHLVRLGLEGTRLLTDPDFVVSTVVPAVLCDWAWRLFKQLNTLGRHDRLETTNAPSAGRLSGAEGLAP